MSSTAVGRTECWPITHARTHLGRREEKGFHKNERKTDQDSCVTRSLNRYWNFSLSCVFHSLCPSSDYQSCPTGSQTTSQPFYYLLNIHLLNFHISCIQLRHLHSQHTILQSRCDTIDIHLCRVCSASQSDFAIEGSDFSLV